MDGLIEPRQLNLARAIASLFRVTYLLTAAMPGVLGRLSWRPEPRGGGFVLVVPKDLAGLLGERPEGRLQAFAKIIDKPLRFEVR